MKGKHKKFTPPKNGERTADGRPIFHHDLHWIGWNKLANNPRLKKDDVLELRWAYMFCPACDAVPMCEVCPLQRPKNRNGNRVCGGYGGLFIEWRFASSPDIRSKLSAQIRDLPLSEGWEELP